MTLSGPTGAEAESLMPVAPGKPLPLGAWLESGRVDFLELYAAPGDWSPFFIVLLGSIHFRTGDVWPVWVSGVSAGHLPQDIVAFPGWAVVPGYPPYCLDSRSLVGLGEASK